MKLIKLLKNMEPDQAVRVVVVTDTPYLNNTVYKSTAQFLINYHAELHDTAVKCIVSFPFTPNFIGIDVEEKKHE